MIEASTAREQTICYLNDNICKDGNIIQLSKEMVGYVKTNPDDDKLRFSPNIFAQFLLSSTKIIHLDNVRSIYNFKKGIYEEATDNLLSVIIKFILDEVNQAFGWSSKRRNMIIDALSVSLDHISTNNQYDNLLPVNNSIIDLFTGDTLPFSSDYYLTRRVCIDYTPETDCPKFKKFVNETACGNTRLMKVIQEICGYILINNCKAAKFFIWYGTGANGKSVLMNIINCVIGVDNISTVPLTDFSYTFGLHMLVGKMVNIASENECSTVDTTEKIKSITCGERITINKKYSDSYEAFVKTKLIFLTNNLPTFKDTSNGIFRRMMVIPFNNNVPSKDINPHLYDELVLERVGIFNWMLAGAKRLVKNNYQFTSCKAVDRAMNAYQKQLNPVLEYVAECVVQSDDLRVSCSFVRNHYHNWLTQNGYDSNSTNNANKFWNSFRDAIKEKYGDTLIKEKSNGVRYIVGYDVLTNNETFG